MNRKASPFKGSGRSGSHSSGDQGSKRKDGGSDDHGSGEGILSRIILRFRGEEDEDEEREKGLPGRARSSFGSNTGMKRSPVGEGGSRGRRPSRGASPHGSRTDGDVRDPDVEELPPEEDRDRRRWRPRLASKEGIVISSLFMYLFLLILYYTVKGSEPGLFSQGSNFQIYTALVFFSTLVMFLIAAALIYREGPGIVRSELKGFAVFLVGAAFLILIPIGSSLGILHQGHDVLGSVNLILFILAIPAMVMGTVMLARHGGFFLPWFTGTTAYMILMFHEAARFLFWTGNFGVYDLYLVRLSVTLILISSVLYLYGELKFIILFKLVDRALERKKEGELVDAMKILDLALAIYPDFKTALNNRGNIFFALDEPDDAMLCYNRILEMDPDYILARKNLETVEEKASRRSGKGRRKAAPA